MPRVTGTRAVLGFVAKRLVRGLLIIWFLLTLVWVLIRLKPERTNTLPLAGFEPGSGSFGSSPLDAYTQFLIDLLTVDWSPAVLATWEQTAPVTLMYLVPALVVSSLGGILVPMYAAMVPGGWLDRAVSGFSTLGIGVPTFVLVEVAIAIAPQYGVVIEPYDPRQRLLHPDNLLGFTLPAGMLALPLVGLMMRYSREEALAEETAEFVTTARSKGAGRARVALHVLRNTWASLAQVVFSELVGLILLGTIVIEIGFQMPGLAVAFFRALQGPDLGLILSVTLVVVTFGTLGSLLQDVTRLLSPDR